MNGYEPPAAKTPPISGYLGRAAGYGRARPESGAILALPFAGFSAIVSGRAITWAAMKNQVPWRRIGQVAFWLTVGALLSVGGRQAARRLDRELALESCRRHDLRDCERLCAGGHVESCFQLGEIHAQGRGVAVDAERAIALFELACREWDRRGCRELGLIYREGLWRPRDLKRAVELLQLACDGPEGQACTALGTMYEVGAGVGRDPRRAAQLFERGCSAYDAEGCARAGALQLRADGAARDPRSALGLLERGCRGGVALGCSVLAEVYGSGWDAAGTGRDEAKARLFKRRACDRGALAACRDLGDPGGGAAPGTSGR